MKKLKLFLLLTLSLLVVIGVNAQHHRSHYTSDRSSPRSIEKEIQKGINKGLLTKKEVRQLRADLHDIDRMKYKAMRNNRISKKEHRRIDHAIYEFELKLDKFLYNRHRNHKMDIRTRRSIKERGHSCERSYDYYYN